MKVLRKISEGAHLLCPSMGSARESFIYDAEGAKDFGSDEEREC